MRGETDLTDKDEQAEHLDRLSKACVFLMRKYDVRPFPQLEMEPFPLVRKDMEGKTYLLKGNYSADGNTITILDDPDAVLTLTHEFHHFLDHRAGKCTVPTAGGASKIGGLGYEKEKKIEKRALADLKEFRVWEIAYGLDLAKRKEERERVREKMGS